MLMMSFGGNEVCFWYLPHQNVFGTMRSGNDNNTNMEYCPD